MDEWTTQQGEKRSRLRVRADAIKFVGSRREGDAAPGSAAAQSAPATPGNPGPVPPPTPPTGPVTEDPDDLPF